MGLAAYGNPAGARAGLRRLLEVSDTAFTVNAGLARFRAADLAGLTELFGPARRPDEDPTLPRFADVAAALQERSEEALLALAPHLHRLTGEAALAYAGGVALNCVANARLEREGPFRELYIPGAAHDAGTALGAAQWLAHEMSGARPARSRLPLTPFLGPGETETPPGGRPVDCPAKEAAERLAAGQLVGWFQGALEFGPRALGHRSLLAHPGARDRRERLNDGIKHREPFRPFAAAVLRERLRDWFEVPTDRPGGESCRELMLLAYPVIPARRASIPAVVHRDGSCRIQAVDERRDALFHQLLREFEALTGLPLVLNTSFNDSEPIVCTPADALSTFRRTGLDALLIGSTLFTRD